jgi:hypothetical protein
MLAAQNGGECFELRVSICIIRRSPASVSCVQWRAPRATSSNRLQYEEALDNANQCRVNKHGYRQRKSDHLNHQEGSERERREYHNHNRGGARNQACGSG